MHFKLYSYICHIEYFHLSFSLLYILMSKKVFPSTYNYCRIYERTGRDDFGIYLSSLHRLEGCDLNFNVV